MSKDDPNNINAYHNQGEKDRAEGNGYNPPNGFLGGAFNSDYENEQRQSYEAGWDNADKQAQD